jgi:hypothetical protein
MKLKILAALMLGALFLLSACSNPCEGNEERVNGVCVPVLNTPLEKALFHIQNADNYALDITLQLDFTQVDLSIQFDETRIFYDFVDEPIYFESSAEGCFEYTQIADSFVKTEVACSASTSAYGFYLNFEASMFESEEDGFRMLEEYHTIIEDFFSQTLTNPNVSSVELTLMNERLNQLKFTLQSEQDRYEFTLTFSNFDSVTVNLPQE